MHLRQAVTIQNKNKMAQVDFNDLDFRKVHPIKLFFAEKYIYDIDYIFFADTEHWDAKQTNMFFQEKYHFI